MISEELLSCVKAIIVVTTIKILLIPSYHSTDFEVHRNWLAITHSLPVSKWYYEHTSEWTLDYPPFFAWFEYGLSLFAGFFDEKMLDITNLNYASPKTVLFQRLTVQITDFVLIFAVAYYFRLFSDPHPSKRTLTVFFLILFAPGFLIVDHIHFQYNGYLIGLFTLSIVLVYHNHPLLGALVYSIAMNSKHLFCFQAPIFLVFLLRTYCFDSSLRFSFRHFFQLAAIVLAIFFFSLYPVLRGNIPANLRQFLSRLFPFQRGIIHSYWAPNLWALYAGIDRILAALLPALCRLRGVFCHIPVLPSNTADGRVEIATFSVLPEVSSILTILLMLGSYIPVILSLWRRGDKKAFLRSVSLTTFLYFLCGWHVHEKAILPTVILCGLLAGESARDARIFWLLSLSGSVGLFPLLFTPRDVVTEVMLTGVYGVLSWQGLELALRPLDWLAVMVLGGSVIAYCVGPLLVPSLPFLPLMAVSLGCAVVNCYVFVLMAVQFFVHPKRV
ncbi:hypothetical protein WA588_002747 [Blastocystis sp. NMH]